MAQIEQPIKEPVKQKKPSPAKQRNLKSESKIVNKIKLSIQKATSISQASEIERPYFEAVEQLHKLREKPPTDSKLRQKQFYQANLEVIRTVPDDSFRDRALGLLLGSMIADSCGSYLGF